MLLLGIDLGTSSIKVSVVDAATQKLIASVQYPETETLIISPHPGWAEQSPEDWWHNIKHAILKCNATKLYDPQLISSIGIAYQMHGLVLVDKNQNVLRNSIIWCDSRAVEIGDDAFNKIGPEKCLSSLLNSPGNFTAAKLAWVKQNEPDVYKKIDKVLLPGDFIAMKLSGAITTTPSALSEGIFWDFQNNNISATIIDHFGFDYSLFPEIRPVFALHGVVTGSVSSELGLKAGTVVGYKAGDQLNNALSLNVFNPGEVAATSGTSGVIYGVSGQMKFDNESRINSFAHVSHSSVQTRIGILLCINGAGIMMRWIKNMFGGTRSYNELNAAAAAIKQGADGLILIPFGNGAERMLSNKIIGAHFHDLDLNIHTDAHMVRATQEGIAFAFRYGLDIMRENGLNPSMIRAGKSNLFLSDVFVEAFVNTTGVALEFYEGDGSYGAAIGGGIGAGIFKQPADAFVNRKPIGRVEPVKEYVDRYDELYNKFKYYLNESLKRGN